MDLNDPVTMAQVVVEQEAERVRAEKATKPLKLYTVGALTVEELAEALMRIVHEDEL